MQSFWKSTALALILLFHYGWSSDFLSGCRFSSWYSDEQGLPADRLIGYPVTGLMCRGGYCDDLRFQQCTGITDIADHVDLAGANCHEPVLPFSEEGNAMGQCPNGQFVEGIKCEGGFCDTLTLRCCWSSVWHADVNQIWTSPWFSEENQSGQMCPPMHVIIGARCSGGWCDNIQLICARVVAVSDGDTSNSIELD